MKARELAAVFSCLFVLRIVAACSDDDGDAGGPSSDASSDGRNDDGSSVDAGGDRLDVDAAFDGGPGCRASGWCWENPAPYGDALSAVWGATANDVWTVSYAGAILHFDGAAWTRTSLPVTTDLRAVWGTTADDVWAGGERGVMVHWDGTKWSFTEEDAGAGAFTSIHGSAKNNVWAVSQYGSAEVRQWNGATWIDRRPTDALASNDWRAVVVRAPDDVFLASGGGSTTPILRWDGMKWTSDSPDVQGQYVSVTAFCGTSTGELFTAVMTAPEESRFFRRSATGEWKLIATRTNEGMSSCWATGANEAWFVGRKGLRIRCDATSCTPSQPVPEVDLSGIGPAGNDVWIVGGAATTLKRTADDTWTQTPARAAPITTANLVSVHALSPTDVWAVGETVLHRDAAGWSVANARAGGGTMDKSGLNSIYAIGANDVWAVGQGGAFHWDGAAWTPKGFADGGVLPPVTNVSASGPNDVWAVGGTLVWHWTGASWSLVDSNDDAGAALAPFYFRIAAVSPTDVWLGGPFSLVHYDGMTWKKVNAATTGQTLIGPVSAISAFPNNVWFATGFGLDGGQPGIYHWTGASYDVTPLPGDWRAGASLPKLGGAPNDLWYLAGGGIAHSSGGAWAYDDRPTAGLSAITAAGGTAWAVGPNGAILRRQP